MPTTDPPRSAPGLRVEAELQGGGAALGSFLGSGLRAGEMAAVLWASVLVFLLWDGPLWSAPSGSSHAGRIAVSYLLVPPACAVLLFALRRFSLGRLLSSVALVWSAKLVITASLYSALAPGAATQYDAAPARASAAPASSPSAMRPVPKEGVVVDISGSVLSAGQPVARGLVFVEAPAEAAPLPAPRDVRIRAGAALAADGPVAATTRDRVVAANDDAALHTVRLDAGGALLVHLPLPRNAAPAELPPQEPGIYEVSCGIHPGERSTLVVLDHPYFAWTDAAGRFALRRVPAGDHRLLVVGRGGVLVRRAVRLEVGAPTFETTLSTGDTE